MTSASELFNLTDVYLDDFQYTDASTQVRSSHELAENTFIPRNLDGHTKMKIIKTQNKTTKINPPKMTKHSLRPDLTDIEIALIVTSFNTTPTSIIAHTLNISKRTVEDIYNQYKHEPLAQVPLIAISDTSRYISPDNLRHIYDSQEFHHLDDPLTNKELLRQESLKSNKEEKIDSICYTNYISQRLQEGYILKSPTRSAGHITPVKDFEDGYFGLYGRTWGENFSSVFNKSLLTNTSYTIKNNVSEVPSHIMYYAIKTNRYDSKVHVIHRNYHISDNIHIPTNLAKTYLNIYNKTPDNQKEVFQEDSSWTQVHTYLTIPLLYNSPNSISNFIHSEPTVIRKDSVTYTTNRKDFQNYKPKDNHFYLQYHILRPSIYDRCIASPLQDKNGNLRYTFPKNTYKPLTNDQDKYDTTFPAIHCNNCKTFLSKHTVTTCECKQITITVNTLKLQKRTNNVKLKHLKINLKTLPKDLKDKVLKYTTNTTSKVKYAYGKVKDLKPNSSKNRNLYQYTSSIKYQHQFYQNTKTFIQVFKEPQATFSFHLYNYSPKLKNKHHLFNITPNILSLYTSFNFPLSNTSQEPYVT